jgi:hypothetical protein
VAQLRLVYLPPDPVSHTAYAGEIGQHNLWFPDIELPVSCGQVRTAKQLPVLTMVTVFPLVVGDALLATGGCAIPRRPAATTQIEVTAAMIRPVAPPRLSHCLKGDSYRLKTACLAVSPPLPRKHEPEDNHFQVALNWSNFGCR